MQQSKEIKVPKEIEDYIFTTALPVNTKVMIRRLGELLDKHQTNCLEEASCRNDPQIRKLLWLINQQFYGQLSIINMCEEWNAMDQAEKAQIKSQ